MLCCRYADDVSASISFNPGDDINEIKMKITRCLNDILHFSASHGLALNPDKTCGVIIGKKKVRDKIGKFELNFDGNPIDFKDEIELLGCHVNENLELNTFIEEKMAKCRARIAMLYRLKIKSEQVRKHLATSLVLSVMDYGNSILHETSQKNLNKYQKIIRATIRYIKGLKRHEPTSADAKNLHILDAKNRIRYKVALLFWKTVHLRQPRMLAEIIEPI